MRALRDLRQGETEAELDRLCRQLKDWLDKRTQKDPRGQYATQLTCIAGEIGEALQAVRTAVAAVSGIAGTGQAFRELALNDRRIIWVHNAWAYFRDKFDQRDDDALGPVLRAADEVLWSCYKPFFSGGPIPPAPLCCIDATYAPAATRPDQAAHQFGRNKDIDEGPLKALLRSLPVPILRLPQAVASAPWMLALIGHETGHFIQRAGPDAAGFREWMEGQIEAAVQRAGGAEADVKAWRLCTEEIFGDWYFVVTMGAWALWVIAPWVTGTQAEMLARQRAYPAPVVRLRLIAAMAEACGLVGAATLGEAVLAPDIAAAATPSTALDLRIAAEVANIVVLKVPQWGVTLSERLQLTASSFAARDEVELWSDALVGARQKADQNELRTARLVAAAAVKASYHAALIDDEAARTQRLDVLRKAAPLRIAGCFERGHRSAQAAVVRPPGDLARLMLSVGADVIEEALE